MERIYNFAIVRVSPDPRRGELINIGIIVFLPRKVDVHILPSLAKVQALHGELDLSELHALPQKLTEFAKTQRSVADRHALLRSVGMMELSELGQFRARDEREYGKAVEELIINLVKPTAAIQEREAVPSRLYSQVRKIIREAKMLGRAGDIDKHKIVQQFPLNANKGLYADFAGKNSQFYVTETIDFRVDRGIQGAKYNESAKATLVLRESRQQFPESNRIVLYAASTETEGRVHPHLNLLGEFATDFINFESGMDRARYIQQLAAAFGGELPLPPVIARAEFPGN